MDWIQIGGIILSSGVISAGINWLANRSNNTKLENQKSELNKTLEDHKLAANKDLEIHKLDQNTKLEIAKSENASALKRLEGQLNYLQAYQQQSLTQDVNHVKEITRRQYEAYDALIEAMSPLMTQARHPNGETVFKLALEPESLVKTTNELQRMRQKYYWLSPFCAERLMIVSEAVYEVWKQVDKFIEEFGDDKKPWEDQPALMRALYRLGLESWVILKPEIEILHEQVHKDLLYAIPAMTNQLLKGLEDLHRGENQNPMLDRKGDSNPHGEITTVEGIQQLANQQGSGKDQEVDDRLVE